MADKLRAISRLKTAWESTGETITVFEPKDEAPVGFILLRHKKMTACLVEVDVLQHKRKSYFEIPIPKDTVNRMCQHVKFGGVAFYLVKFKDSYGTWKIPEPSKWPDGIDLIDGCYQVPENLFRVL